MYISQKYIYIHIYTYKSTYVDLYVYMGQFPDLPRSHMSRSINRKSNIFIYIYTNANVNASKYENFKNSLGTPKLLQNTA